MGLFSKDIKTMDDLFLHTLQDVYYAENQIVKGRRLRSALLVLCSSASGRGAIGRRAESNPSGLTWNKSNSIYVFKSRWA